MELFIASTPQAPPPPGTYTSVWAACCTGDRLQVCEDLPRGGYLMVLYGKESRDSALLARDILRLCLADEHPGILLDLPPGSEHCGQIVKDLAALCPKYGISLAVPESYAAMGGDLVILPSAPVGGNLQTHLQKAAASYGAGRILLDLERTCRDYLLPCPAGPGHCMDQETFRRLSCGCTYYFSPELCARYFTYRCGTQSHYVVYDDADTLRRKMAHGEELGITKGVMVYGEVKDLWPL